MYQHDALMARQEHRPPGGACAAATARQTARLSGFLLAWPRVGHDDHEKHDQEHNENYRRCHPTRLPSLPSEPWVASVVTGHKSVIARDEYHLIWPDDASNTDESFCSSEHLPARRWKSAGWRSELILN
jgi:hypothetical protein